MSEFKLLIDTNIVIGLEDARPVQASLAELVRLCGEHDVGLFVQGANYDDVNRDRNVERRAVTLSKLSKFQQLRDLPTRSEEELASRFGSMRSANDRSDVGLLEALEAKAVDFVVSQDNGLLRRAERSGLAQSVFTVEDALDWLRQSFQTSPVSLPYVVERKAYQIDLDEPIFDGLRSDYPEFDAWFDKCRRSHRDCWALELGTAIAGLVVRKDESHSEAGTRHPGPKILKVCTLKVRDEFRGEKFGELLLKQILWFAQRNQYDLVYLTVFEKHGFLIDLLAYYGFAATQTKENREIVMEKALVRGESPRATDVFTSDRLNYPRFHDEAGVRKYAVPIQSDYHQRLFPEIAFGKELPLFPRKEFGSLLGVKAERTPGNTIRKVYLCRAKTKALRPGDLLFFYLSKTAGLEASQSITTIGVVEQVAEVTSADDLIRLTAKRSVFSADQIRELSPSSNSPVKMIDFLLVGHVLPVVSLQTLVDLQVFAGRPPQSIAQIIEEKYARLRPLLNVGFQF